MSYDKSTAVFISELQARIKAQEKFLNDINEAWKCREERASFEALDKRRNIAKDILVGMMSHPKCQHEDVKHNAIVAVRQADALLENLERKT